MPNKLLRGERVSLRPIESEEDLRYLFRAFNDPEAMGEYVNFEARSWDGFQAWVREASRPPSSLVFFLIVKNHDDKSAIGSVVHFVPSPLSKSCLEIGYGIDDLSLRGKGYASEAVKLLIDYLFSTRPLERIQATIIVENLPSQQVVEKLGFTKEGTMRKNDFVKGRFVDTLVYSLLREEWEKSTNV